MIRLDKIWVDSTATNNKDDGNNNTCNFGTPSPVEIAPYNGMKKTEIELHNLIGICTWHVLSAT